MPIDINEIAEKLGNARRTSNGFDCQCPCHDDAHASLSLSVRDDGDLLWHCKAGCSQMDVLGELRGRGLLGNGKGGGDNGGDAIGYHLHDAEGKYVATKWRADKFGGGKKMWWGDREGGGLKLADMGYPSTAALPLYRTERAGVCEPYLIVEGEGKADAMAALDSDLTVLGTVTGANGVPSDESLKICIGYDVELWPDNDAPGRDHMRRIAAALKRLGIASLYVDWPDAGPKQDCADFVEAGKTLKDFYGLPRTEKIASEPAAESVPSDKTDIVHGRKCTDLGNCERMIDSYGADFLHVYEWDWLHWNQRIWEHDHGAAHVRQAAAKRARATWGEAAAVAGDNDMSRAVREGLSRHAKSSESKRGIDAAVALFADHRPARPEKFDRKSTLFAVGNGTINLATGELQAHRREDMITKIAPVKFDAAADCPIWDRFLAEVLPDPDVRDFLQRFVGYSMTSDVSERVVVFLYGLGANGKTVFVETVAWLLGSYATTTAPDLLMDKRGETHPAEVADLEGARLAVCAEVKQGKTIDEAILKRLSGGDSIKARLMRENFRAIEPTWKLIFSGNHQPSIRDTTDSIWDRLRQIPFEIRIPEDKQDKRLRGKLRGLEGPGILNWAVAGCLAWQRDGLAAPDAVLAATASYRESEDYLGPFFDECTERDTQGSVSAKDFFAIYKAWAEENGQKPVTQRTLAATLRERGYIRQRKRSGVHWDGLILTDYEASEHPVDKQEQKEFKY